MEDNGAAMVAVHGRTRAMLYSGTADWDYIRKVKEQLSIPVIANGGIVSPETAEVMRRETGCSRLMLAQGAMGNPWLFDKIEKNASDPTLEEWKEIVHGHIVDMISLYGEEVAMRSARKIVHDYLKGRGFPSGLRAEASALAALKDLDRLLEIARPAVSRSPSPRGIC